MAVASDAAFGVALVAQAEVASSTSPGSLALSFWASSEGAGATVNDDGASYGPSADHSQNVSHLEQRCKVTLMPISQIADAESPTRKCASKDRGGDSETAHEEMLKPTSCKCDATCYSNELHRPRMIWAAGAPR